MKKVEIVICIGKIKNEVCFLMVTKVQKNRWSYCSSKISLIAPDINASWNLMFQSEFFCTSSRRNSWSRIKLKKYWNLAIIKTTIEEAWKWTTKLVLTHHQTGPRQNLKYNLGSNRRRGIPWKTWMERIQKIGKKRGK